MFICKTSTSAVLSIVLSVEGQHFAGIPLATCESSLLICDSTAARAWHTYRNRVSKASFALPALPGGDVGDSHVVHCSPPPRPSEALSTGRGPPTATLCGGFGAFTSGGARAPRPAGGGPPGEEPRLHVLPARPGAVIVDDTRALPLPVPARAPLLGVLACEAVFPSPAVHRRLAALFVLPRSFPCDLACLVCTVQIKIIYIEPKDIGRWQCTKPHDLALAKRHMIALCLRISGEI